MYYKKAIHSLIIDRYGIILPILKFVLNIFNILKQDTEFYLII